MFKLEALLVDLVAGGHVRVGGEVDEGLVLVGW